MFQPRVLTLNQHQRLFPQQESLWDLWFFDRVQERGRGVNILLVNLQLNVFALMPHVGCSSNIRIFVCPKITNYSISNWCNSHGAFNMLRLIFRIRHFALVILELAYQVRKFFQFLFSVVKSKTQTYSELCISKKNLKQYMSKEVQEMSNKVLEINWSSGFSTSRKEYVCVFEKESSVKIISLTDTSVSN